jgi:hypothetical protein
MRTGGFLMSTSDSYHAILFVQHGCQYYVSARFAMHAQCVPINGILFHHAIEMLLKGALLEKRTLSDVEQMRHWLKRIWRAFKEDFPAPQLKHHDGTISSLAKFHDLRYWEVESAGMTSQWERPAHHVIVYGGMKTPKQYVVVVSDIDDLVADIFKAASWNPGKYMGTNPSALEM